MFAEHKGQTERQNKAYKRMKKPNKKKISCVFVEYFRPFLNRLGDHCGCCSLDER